MRAVTRILACLFVCANGATVPSSGKISGGAPAGLVEFPFATALLTNYGSGTVYTQYCGGSILTTTAILSAASCYNDQGVNHAIRWWRARVGSVNSNAGGTVHAIRLITSHPNYSWTTGDNDVAVLRVTIPMTFVPNTVGAGFLAGASYTVATNQAISAIGWGQISENGASSPELRSVQFWVVNHETCRNRYQAIGFAVTDNMVCAGWLDVGVRAQCKGDAGSPLLHNGVIVGVHSWTRDCNEGWFPGINTWVPAFTSWIVASATT